MAITFSDKEVLSQSFFSEGFFHRVEIENELYNEIASQSFFSEGFFHQNKVNKAKETAKAQGLNPFFQKAFFIT